MRRRLVADNLALAGMVVREMLRSASVRRLGRDEALSVATLTLVVAARTFDPARGFAFSTYAARSMKAEVWRAAGNCGVISLPRDVWAKSYCRQNRQHERNRRAASLASRVVNESALYEGVPAGLAGFDRNLADGNEGQAGSDCRLDMDALLACLDPTDRLILERHVGLGLTRAAVGKEIGVCKARVGQRLERALEKLRGHRKRGHHADYAQAAEAGAAGEGAAEAERRGLV